MLKAIDHVIEKKLADPSKIAVLGGSHGGFLTTHLIGQVGFFQDSSLPILIFIKRLFLNYCWLFVEDADYGLCG